MNLRSSLLRSLAQIGLVLGAVSPLVAQNNSPFLPPAAATNVATPTAGAPLQYKGFMEDSNGTRYRIHDPARKSGAWLKLNERDATFDVTVKQAGQNNATVVVEYQGRTITLALPESKVGSSGSAAAVVPVAAPPPQMTNVPPAVTQAVVVNPTPADEQRRLQAVADEVSRRRALREQAQQQMNQGGPPGGATQAPGAPGQPRRP
jgi:hypothetical protein